ncbi:MAG: prepilin-type N-terminal cleavage/methylation domain-containing protein [Clostridia bacterium]|nr:prepilin-type N-terminal cleavage/methylation domain-containing protein [Clostridia bacterium]
MLPTTKLRNNHKGVTLVEVIAVIAVLGVVMAAVMGFMISGARMSAKVSNGATAGMREQTAVEFINQRIWSSQAVTLGGEPITEGEPQKYSELKIGGLALTSTDGKVTYNNVELCNGEIYFEKISDTTIKYTLNDVEHIVHLRTTALNIAEEN